MCQYRYPDEYNATSCDEFSFLKDKVQGGDKEES